MLVDRCSTVTTLPLEGSCSCLVRSTESLIRRPRCRSCVIVVQSTGGSSKRKARARRPGVFEVQRINPPPKSLGIHNLPADTHNGDQITVEDEDFVVTSLVLQYKLVGGRYQRDHNRLEVQQTSRYFVNLYYDSLLEKSA